MEEWLASGLIVEVILGIIAIEAAVLVYWAKHDALRLGVSLAAGACLLMALRQALVDASSASILIWLGLALPFHLADLWFRQKK